MERQEQLARRMERARRSDWEKLAAINTVVGDTKGAWQQRAEKALAVLHRHGLSKVQRELTDELQASGPRSIGARLAYTREDWLEEAAFMRGLFLRSARVSTLRQYVDEAGRARPAALADGRRRGW